MRILKFLRILLRKTVTFSRQKQRKMGFWSREAAFVAAARSGRRPGRSRSHLRRCTSTVKYTIKLYALAVTDHTDTTTTALKFYQTTFQDRYGPLVFFNLSEIVKLSEPKTSCLGGLGAIFKVLGPFLCFEAHLGLKWAGAENGDFGVLGGLQAH